jgi:hypothetical protein
MVMLGERVDGLLGRGQAHAPTEIPTLADVSFHANEGRKKLTNSPNAQIRERKLWLHSLYLH